MDMLPVWNDERCCWTLGETETHWVELVPQLMGLAFICLTPKACTGVYDQRWDYPNIGVALHALIEWEGKGFTGEPANWCRHLPTHRRRENGDPATEYVPHD